MGMNMVSKGVENVLKYLQSDYPDMEVIGISGRLFLLCIHFLVLSMVDETSIILF